MVQLYENISESNSTDMGTLAVSNVHASNVLSSVTILLTPQLLKQSF